MLFIFLDLLFSNLLIDTNLQFWTTNHVLSPIWISLKTAIIATAITFFLGVVAGLWMVNYQGKGKNFIDGILTAPLVLPPTVVGFLLLLILGKNGLIGKLLDLVGIRVIFTWYATVIAATVVAFPLMYKTSLAAFQQSNNNLLACARTLGASEKAILWRITLPLAKPGLIAGTLLSFARALGEFGATLMLAGSIPGQTQTIPIAIFFAAESGAMIQALWLVVVLLSISLSTITGINYWQNRESRKDRKNKFIRGNRLLAHGKDLESKKTKSIQLEVNIQKQLPEFLLDIAFQIDSKQAPIGILGASGMGKSTLLRCIAGLETPDRGKIVLNNKVLFDSAQKINLPPQERKVGLVFQNYALFPHLTAAENVAFGMSNKKSTSTIKQEVTRQLQQLNLSGIENCFPHQLSGGEQQRLALARVLASNPILTLLDEPFSALDSSLKTKLTTLLQKRVNQYSGLSIYVTHNFQEAYQLCPQLLLIDYGKAIAFGTRKDIVYNPPNIKTAQISGYKNFSKARKNSSETIKALDWQCNLQIERPIPKDINYIAVRSHAITLVNNNQGINTFPVWLAQYIEFPDMVVLYLKLRAFSENAKDWDLESEITIEKWLVLQNKVLPWYVQVQPEQIAML